MPVQDEAYMKRYCYKALLGGECLIWEDICGIWMLYIAGINFRI